MTTCQIHRLRGQWGKSSDCRVAPLVWWQLLHKYTDSTGSAGKGVNGIFIENIEDYWINVYILYISEVTSACHPDQILWLLCSHWWSCSFSAESSPTLAGHWTCPWWAQDKLFDQTKPLELQISQERNQQKTKKLKASSLTKCFFMVSALLAL